MGIIEEGAGVSDSEERKQFVEEKYQEFLEEYKEALDTHDGDPIYSVSLEMVKDESLNEYYTFNIRKKSVSGDWTIDFWGVEGQYIDHFHLKSSSEIKLKGGKEKKFDGCIRLFESSPFVHGIHTDSLDNIKDGKEVAKALNQFLSQKSEEDPSLTRWEYFKKIWIDQGGDTRHIPKEQPDYTNLV